MSAPRLKSGIWVAALLRRSSVEGMYGAVLNTGMEEAGAVYVVLARSAGMCDFLGPAPGEAYAEDGSRRFVRLVPGPAPWPEIRARIDALRKVDPDIWVVEIEARDGMAGLKVETE